jgi:threonine/homoserine/homoserine lactone efflux protein
MIGWLMITFGGALVAWTLYSMFVKRTTSWIFGALLVAGGAALAYYGYQMEYPPVPSLFTGGKSRWSY